MKSRQDNPGKDPRRAYPKDNLPFRNRLRGRQSNCISSDVDGAVARAKMTRNSAIGRRTKFASLVLAAIFVCMSVAVMVPERPSMKPQTEAFQESGWGTPELIEYRRLGAYTPQLASDGAGNATAVWGETNGVCSGIWSNRYEAESGWGEAEQVETDDTAGAYVPHVAMDGAGNAIAVWRQLDAVWANRYVVGVGWGVPERIEAPNSPYAGEVPQIAMDNAGNAIVVWELSEGGNSSIWSNRYVVGSGWGTAELIETDDSGYCYRADVAMDGLGNAVAVWTQNLGELYSVWSNRYEVGSGWSDATPLETSNTQDAWYAAVAVDESGNATAVWNQGPPSTMQWNIWSNRFVQGEGWETAVPIEDVYVYDSASNPVVEMDSQGNAVAAWVQWNGECHDVAANRFVVGSGWGTPTLLETNNGETVVTDVDVDSTGNAVVVWDQYGSGNIRSIWSNRYNVGSGWETAELLETDDRGSAGECQVAMNSAGDTVAMWRQWDGSRDNIWSNRHIVGTAWESARIIGTTLPDSYHPQVAVDEAGNAIVVWDQIHLNTHFDIWSCRYNVSHGWEYATLVETNDSGNAGEEQVAVDRMGNATVVWRQWDGVRNNIWSNRRLASGMWGDATLIETGAGNANAPQIAMNDAGDGFAVWQQSDGAVSSIWSNRYDVGTGWGTAELAETDDSGSAFGPQVAIDSNGNAVAVWLQSDGTLFSVWSNRYVVGSGWQTAQLIETDDSGDADYSVDVAMDGSGNAIAVWQQSDGTRDNIWSNRYVASTGLWGIARLIETDNAGGADSPTVAMNRAGDAVVVWVQSDGTRNNAWSNRYVASSGQWSTAQLIETNNSGGVSYADVGMDYSGNAIAVWTQFNGSTGDIWSNRYVVGIGWGVAQLIEDRPGYASSSRIAVHRTGSAFAVWRQPISIMEANIWSNQFRSILMPILPIQIDDSLSSGNNWAWARTQPWCRGSGTLADPYMISWVSVSNASTCIDIRNSIKYFRIENCSLQDSDAAISLTNVQNGMIIHNEIKRIIGHGISLSGSANNEVRENEVNETTGGGSGVYLWESSDNTINNNTISFTHFGIYPEGSDWNKIENNTLVNNGWAISASNSNYCTFMFNHLDRSDNQGLVLEMTSHNTVVGNHVTNSSRIGMWVFSSSSIVLRDNNASDNFNHGIMLIGTDLCDLIGNVARNNTGDGIFLLESSNATVSNCVLRSNNRGLEIDSSNDSVVYGNNVSSNGNEGVLVRNASLNTVRDNEIWGNGLFGVNISAGSSSNWIFNNSFGLNNGAVLIIYDPEHVQAFDDTGTGNYWNTSGTPHGHGNIWWDWQWPDDDSDGIVDAPYDIAGDAGAKDNYPITTPGGIPIPEFPFSSVLPIVGMIGMFLAFGLGRVRRTRHHS